MNTGTLSAAFASALKHTVHPMVSSIQQQCTPLSSEDMLLSVLRGNVTRADQIVARRAMLRSAAWEIVA
jgi:hypothetical protein